jgi:hypothetical protein
MQVRVLASAETEQQLQTIEDTSKHLHPALSSEAAFKRELLNIQNQKDTKISGLRVSLESVQPARPNLTKDENLRSTGWLKGDSGPPVELAGIPSVCNNS